MSRQVLVYSRVFWKSSRAGSAWVQLNLMKMDKKEPLNDDDSFGSDGYYNVPGMKHPEMEGELVLSDTYNYRAAPAYFRNGETGQVQVQTTLAQTEAKKKVFNCRVVGDDAAIFGEKGARVSKFTLKQCGAYYDPENGDTIPTGIDTLATINPDNNPAMLLPTA